MDSYVKYITYITSKVISHIGNVHMYVQYIVTPSKHSIVNDISKKLSVSKGAHSPSKYRTSVIEKGNFLILLKKERVVLQLKKPQ